MNRELLQRALESMDHCALNPMYQKTMDALRAELAKPEPVEVGWIDLKNGILCNRWMTDGLESGKYRLLAERIDDATTE
jgi:hypothetical protein